MAVKGSKCERCGKEAHYLEVCNYCSRTVCRNCQKSSSTPEKTRRLVICKDCWGKIPLRKQFKSA